MLSSLSGGAEVIIKEIIKMLYNEFNIDAPKDLNTQRGVIVTKTTTRLAII